jgi:GntR family transcriptional regulator
MRGNGNLMNGIVHDSTVPYYQQLYDHLHKRIVEGRWRPGDMLPSETELIEQYQVSRVTVRQALALLVKDGLIYRRRGLGTFVSVPKIEQGLNRIISFSEDMRRRGFQAGTTVLSSGLLPAPQEIAERLEMVPGDEIAYLERLRLADGEPLSIEISHLVHELCPGILQQDFARAPLREALARDYKLLLKHARQQIRAIAAPQDVADKLSIRTGDPLFYIERISYSQSKYPVEYLQLYHRGDRYTLYNELEG